MLFVSMHLTYRIFQGVTICLEFSFTKSVIGMSGVSLLECRARENVCVVVVVND